jgi:hypothetical protein
MKMTKEELAALRTPRTPALRRWEAESEPPDGFYAAWFPNLNYPCRFVHIKSDQVSQDWKRDWFPLKQLFNIDGVFYGPIPEPEWKQP